MYKGQKRRRNGPAEKKNKEAIFFLLAESKRGGSKFCFYLINFSRRSENHFWPFHINDFSVFFLGHNRLMRFLNAQPEIYYILAQRSLQADAEVVLQGPLRV